MAGDAVIRQGLRGRGPLYVAVGCAVLAGYGILINVVKWDFSKLLGVYIAVFAIIAVLCGRFYFHERIPSATWTGLAFIVVGGLIIQFGRS